VTLRIVQPGMFTTVQDLGRTGHQRFGVPVSGAMDASALRIANMMVGNATGHAALETTLVGPTIRFEEDALIAIAGAELGACVGEVPLPLSHPVWVGAGSTLTFRGGPHGCRAVVGVAGGIDVPEVLGSRSTYARANFGGLDGRALRKDDVLRVGSPSPWARRVMAALAREDGRPGIASWGAGPSMRPRYSPAPIVRLLAGTHTECLAAPSRDRLFGDAFRISPQSDRMGYRLEGSDLALTQPLELLSEAVTCGTMQLPPGGAPIILMADAQTTGGYPRIGEVATVDLPLLAQLRPGDHVRFRPCSMDEAQSALLAREQDLAQAQRALTLLHP
jgi:antagonist of KipI